MLVDVVFIILMIIAIFKGFSKGFIVAIFSFLAFIVGMAAALKLSATVAAWLRDSGWGDGPWLPVLAFLLVFIGVVLLVRIGARLVKKVVSLALLGWADTLGGIVLYALLYLFLYSVVLFYASAIGLISEEQQMASRTYSVIAPFGPKVINAIGVVLPFFENMFAELSAFFQNVQEKAQ